jgi:hypothetical protein
VIEWTTEQRKLKDLAEWPKNPRQLSQHDAEHIQRSIDKFGLADPLVVNADGRIIGGHQRKRIMLLMDEYGEDAVIDVRIPSRQLTESEAEELAIRLNRNSGNWDWDILENEFDVDMLLDYGFSEYDFELAGIELPTDEPPVDPGPQIDRAAELQEVWGTKLGQVWELGDHRLVCGDCTDKAIREINIDAVFTDPPYGINRDPKWLDDVGTHRQALTSRDKLQGDDGTIDLSFLWDYKRRMVWGFPYIMDVGATGWIVWDKQPGVDSRGIVTPVEMASTTMRTGFDMVRVMWGGYYRSAGESKHSHPTEKPLGVTEPFIEAWTDEDEVIGDLFLGSGTTLIACERLGRRCRAVEIEPKYIAVALQRWHDLTGKEPKLLEG